MQQSSVHGLLVRKTCTCIEHVQLLQTRYIDKVLAPHRLCLNCLLTMYNISECCLGANLIIGI